jgi:hypothetical protein
MKKIKIVGGLYAIIDDIDFDFLNQFTWYIRKSKNVMYAKAIVLIDGSLKHIDMHRMIIKNLDTTKEIDHHNGDGLDNRRNNLRVCTHSQNIMNSPKSIRLKGTTSKYKGVCWATRERKWVAHIRKDYVLKYLGRFDDEVEAAKAYNIAAKSLHGEYANINIIV